eukprot:g11820.t1
MSPAPAGYYATDNGFMSPPAMMPPANGYMSPAGGAYMSPNAFHHHQHPQHHQSDYPVETRSPCFAGRGALSTPHRYDYAQLHRRGGASVAPFGATRNICGGYRWEECYKQSSGKKFWRHKETGVILTKDPYR